MSQPNDGGFAAVKQALDGMIHLLREHSDLRGTVKDHEHRIRRLEDLH